MQMRHEEANFAYGCTLIPRCFEFPVYHTSLTWHKIPTLILTRLIIENWTKCLPLVVKVQSEFAGMQFIP